MTDKRPPVEVGEYIRVLKVHNNHETWGRPLEGKIVQVSQIDAERDARFAYQNEDRRGCATEWEIVSDHERDLELIYREFKAVAEAEGAGFVLVFNREAARISKLLSRPFGGIKQLPTERGTVIKGSATKNGVKRKGYFVLPEGMHSDPDWFMIKGGWEWIKTDEIDPGWEIVELP